MSPNKIKQMIRTMLRYRRNVKNRKRLINKDFTIISCNCIGGVISHELGMEFRSPTINLFFKAPDFLKFCSNIKHYLNSPLMEIDDSKTLYPVIRCDDITLNCVHYQDFNEVQVKWRARSKRINWKNLFFIMVERDGCTKEDIIKFDALPFLNKVIFVHKPMPDIASAMYIPGTELDGENGQWVKMLTAYKGLFTGKRYIDDFDYVTFLNTGEKRLAKD